jgi:hypothetical protein
MKGRHIATYHRQVRKVAAGRIAELLAFTQGSTRQPRPTFRHRRPATSQTAWKRPHEVGSVAELRGPVSVSL